MIIAKYGEESRWCPKITSPPYGAGPWRYISKLWEEFSSNVYFEVGNGENISVLHDKWVGSSPQKEEFIELFPFVRYPQASIIQCKGGNS